MNRVERHIVIKGNASYQIIDDLCFKSKNLYNYTNYLVRKEFFKTSKLPSKFSMINGFVKENQMDYRSLSPQTSQQVVFQVFQNWASYFKALKSFKDNPDKFSSKPKIPRYKEKNGRNVVVFTNQQCRIKDGYIRFPKSTDLQPLKTMVPHLVQVRIVPQATCYVIEIIYKKEGVQHDLDNNLHLGIDIGLNNLISCVDNTCNTNPFIIKGGIIKSINQYYNKSKAIFQSYIGDKGISKRITRLTHKRNNLIDNYLHHTSRFVIEYCLQYKIGNIVIGHNLNWKQEINLGKRNNQNFVSIPFNTLISQIQYKAEEVGIIVSVTEESYTSKVDHLANEPMEHREQYLGRRVKRGLFKSSTGVFLNSDTNGAIGILRKVIGNGFIPKLNRGIGLMPYKINMSYRRKVLKLSNGF